MEGRSSPRFGVELLPMDAYWKTAYYAILAEKSGFDHVWITDHFNNRNVYVILSLVALHTSKVKFGPGVTNPFLIHPVVTAQALATLSEMAPGRVVLGIGAGDRVTLDMVMEERPKPLTAVKDAVRIIRSIATSGSAQMDGAAFKVKGARLNFTPAGSIPIFIGAQGRDMLRLAGRLGDGILINGSHYRDVIRAMGHIKEGVDDSKRSIDDVEIAAATSMSVSEDVEKAQKAAKPVVAFIVAGAPELILQTHSISLEAAGKVREAVLRWDWKEALANITPGMIEAFSICGTPEVCVEKISKLLEMGATQIIAGSPLGPKVHEAIRIIGEKVLPYFERP